MIFRARELLAHVGCGFGALALNGLLAAEAQAVHERGLDPYAGRSPHYEPRAKRVIFLYMPGGPSHVDLLDPKPRLAVDNGKPLPSKSPSWNEREPEICSLHRGNSPGMAGLELKSVSSCQGWLRELMTSV